MSENRLEKLQALLDENPDDPFLKFAIAKEYEKQGNEPKAYEIFTALITSNPDYIGSYYHLGKLLERNENFKAAFNTYIKGMDRASAQNDQHALSELAGAKLALGDEEDFEEE